MSRPKKPHIPSYRLHKPTGQAVVRLDGHDHYLGKHGTDASREKYERLIAEWLTHKGGAPAPASHVGTAVGPSPSVNEVILAFWRHAQNHYRAADGTPTPEVDNFKYACRPLKRLYGTTPARDFGPLALRAVREEMIREGLCRGTVNARTDRIRRVFRWAASVELVPAAVYQSLQTVQGLRAGRTEAREAEPVKPVRVEHVEAVLPFLPAPVAGMVRLQLATGMRPGEAAAMRADEIDRTGAVWVYRPGSHKTKYRGKDRVIYLGPRAQEALRRFLRVGCPWCGLEAAARHLNWQGDLCGLCADRSQELGLCGPWPPVRVPGDYFLFRPGEAKEEMYAGRRKPGGRACKRKANPKRKAKECYTRHAYRVAVARACVRANVPHWHPGQLRHTAATRLRARYGVEAAKVILGHSRVETSQIYAERDLARAAEIMAEIG